MTSKPCTIDSNYIITSDGKIFSIPRVGTKGGELKHRINAKGYHSVSLGNNAIQHRVHRLVALAFIPNPDNKPQVNHIDANKSNNSVSNLEWVTALENTAHSMSLNLRTWTRGASNHQCKLTQRDVNYMRKHYIPRDKKYGARALARKYGVNKTTIARAISGENW